MEPKKPKAKCTCPEDENTIYNLPSCPIHPFPKNSPLKPQFYDFGSSYTDRSGFQLMKSIRKLKP